MIGAPDWPDPLIRTAWLVLGWGLYCGLHSLLASLAAKTWIARRWPQWLPVYRLVYNGLALLLLLPLLTLLALWRGPSLWTWSGPWAWVANGLALLAVAGFIWSLRYYDGAEFLGLRQWREGVQRLEDQERFALSPLHRFVRHPWYSLGLVLVWTRDMDPALLVSALMISFYLFIGSRLEEQRLLLCQGEVYRRYRALVPGLIPSPWRYLSRAEAAALLEAARGLAGPREG
jgi:protein-S-isoprenylcysteine O-methyltransferase Ste14